MVNNLFKIAFLNTVFYVFQPIFACYSQKSKKVLDFKFTKFILRPLHFENQFNLNHRRIP